MDGETALGNAAMDMYGKRTAVPINWILNKPKITPKFVVSVLAMDRLETTRKCVESVLANSADYKLILTDNGSKDGTAEYFSSLTKVHAHITAVLNPINLLFIPPHNQAFEMAKQMGAKYLITLNDDTEVPAGWLEKLAQPLDAFPNAAISGPKGTMSELNKAMLGFGSGKFEYVEGSCLCAKVELVARQGSLFSDYLDGIYHDDSDLCLRMQRAGHTIHRVDFILKHTRNYAARDPKARERCRACNTKNQATMIRKWAHWNKVRCFNFQIIVKRKFAVGDVLLTTPIIRALKKLWPLCPIDVETNAPDIFKGNPHVRRAAPKIGLQPNAWVIELNGAYERTPNIHVLASYARVAGLEMSQIEQHLDLYFNASDAKLLPTGRWVALHVGPTTWPGRTWPLDRWAVVAERLRSDGWKVLLLGEKGKEVIAHDADYRGQKGFQELAALLIQCSLFVGLDSFPSHAAASVCTPSVVLFGVTNPDMFSVHKGPFVAVKADPNHPDTGKRNKVAGITFMHTTDACMRTITVDQVIAGVRSIIQESNL